MHEHEKTRHLVKLFILGFVTIMAVFAVGAVGFLKLGLADVQADANTPAWASQLQKFTVQASVRRRAAKTQSPVPPTDENLIAGGKVFLNACAGCHGKPGKPPSNPPEYLSPPKFFEAGTHYSEPELFWIVKHGIRRTGMSAYGPFYSDQQLWTVAAFVKRMNRLPSTVLEGIQTKNP
jgi:mono/diheme cytochrome c family protein